MESDGGGDGGDGDALDGDGGSGGPLTRSGVAILGVGALVYGVVQDDTFWIVFGAAWGLLAAALLVQGLFEWREERQRQAARTPDARDDRYDAFGPREPGERPGGPDTR